MRFILIFLFLSLRLFADQSPKEITIGMIPFGDREAIKKAAFAVAKKLQEEVNIPVVVFLPNSYSSLLNAMKAKKVDFAFLTAASYVSLESEMKIQVLLKRIWVEPFYYSVILTQSDSGIKNIDGLKGKKITFVDNKSTSGYLYPQVMFKKKGWTNQTFKELTFSGTHTNSVEALDKKSTDAIAVFSDDKAGEKNAWTKYTKNKNKSAVRVLWVSDPIPNDPFCVRQDFYEQYPKVTHAIMFALIDAVETLKQNKDFVTVIGANGFLPATSKQYDPVREMVKEIGIKE